MRLGILCNGKISLPAIQELVQLGQQPVLFLPEKSTIDHEEIKSFAAYFGIPIHVLSKRKITEELVQFQTNYNFNFLFVITFPYILPKELLERIGVPILNFHYAPLPKYRGIHPVFWLIKNGEKEGGLTIHQITEDVDGGGIVLYESMRIESDDTFGTYIVKAGDLGRQCMPKLLRILTEEAWKDKTIPQIKSEANYWSRPQFNDVLINWQTMTASEIKRLCLACNPWNKGALTSINGKPVKIIEVEIQKIAATENFQHSAGTIVKSKETKEISVKTSDDFLIKPLIVSTEEGFFSTKNLAIAGFLEGKRLI